MPVYSIKDVPEGVFLVKTSDGFRGPCTVKNYPGGPKTVYLHGAGTYEDKWFEPGDTFEPCFTPASVPVPGTYILCSDKGDQPIPCLISPTGDPEMPSLVTLTFSNGVILTPLSNVNGIFLPLEDIVAAPKPYLNRQAGRVEWPKGGQTKAQPKPQTYPWLN